MMIDKPSGKKESILKNFSRYAHLYDKYANIQALAACELIKMSCAGSIGHVLELGCGTGNYTYLLRQRYRDADITATDISEKMISQGRRKLNGENIKFIIADAEEFDPGDRFDLVTSNAAFQWFDDQEMAIQKYRRAISEGGFLLFSIFGPSTFRELGESLRVILGEGTSISTDGFLGKGRLKAMLERHFGTVVVTELVVKERYPSLLELLRKIRYTGTRGSGTGSTLLWKRETLDKVEEAYKEKFGAIEATYQIFLCKAK